MFNTFNKLCLSLLLVLPISALASSYFLEKIEAALDGGFWYILVGAIAGGIASTFIQTEVDSNLSNDRVAKLFIGSFLGFFSCISWVAYYPDTTMMKLALPSFVLGCLGAPIIVFLLTWAADKKTFSKAEKALNKKLGLEGDDPKDE